MKIFLHYIKSVNDCRLTLKITKTNSINLILLTSHETSLSLPTVKYLNLTFIIIPADTLLFV